MKILNAQLNYIIGDFQGNLEKILAALTKAKQTNCEIVLFSEMALSGYPPEDLLLQEGFVEMMETALEKVIQSSKGLFVVLGLVRKNLEAKGKPFFNSAAIIHDGNLLGFHDKCLLPTYDVFDEKRYFEEGKACRVWPYKNQKIAVLICEDIWGHATKEGKRLYAMDPIECLSLEKPDILLSLSASPYHNDKISRRIAVCSLAAQNLKCPLVYCAQVGGNDQLVFDGYSFWMDRFGSVLSMAKGFVEDLKIFDLAKQEKEPFEAPSRVEGLFSALVLGIRDYFHKNGFIRACLGVSGGIDSAVVACLAKYALGKENVLALFMPSRYSSASSLIDAKKLCENLSVNYEEISIEPFFETFLQGLDPYFEGLPRDETEENLQARIRGMLLMAFSNKLGYIVLSTGNKSEMAVGFSTLYGDLCGGLGVISDLTKKQVYEIARYINQKEEIIPANILTKEPSAELKPLQKDSDALPSYEILDQIIEMYVEQGLSIDSISKNTGIDALFIWQIVEKIHKAEYKRRQAPPGIRVTFKSFREGRKVPIVHKWR